MKRTRNVKRQTDTEQTQPPHHVIDNDVLTVVARVVGVAAADPVETRPAAQAVLGTRPPDVDVAHGPPVAAAHVVGRFLDPSETDVSVTSQKGCEKMFVFSFLFMHRRQRYGLKAISLKQFRLKIMTVMVIMIIMSNGNTNV